MTQNERGRTRRIQGINRRAVLGAGFAGLGLVTGGHFSRAETPKQGGVLRLGLGGASTTDSMDPATTQNSVGANLNQQIYSCLVDLDDKTQLIAGLAEKWSSNATLDKWRFELRRGVEFHNGKTLTAEDVVYSLTRHIATDSKSGAKALLSGIKRISGDGKTTVEIELAGGDADFPYVLADYHLGIVPDGLRDWSKPIGTGPFAMKSFDAGVRSLAERNKNYFRDGRPYVDAAEVIAINDWTARLNALQAGEVDIINRVDSRSAARLQSSGKAKVVSSPGRTHYCFVMDTRIAPFNDVNVRLALKHAIDRDAILRLALAGYGTLGNDQSIPGSDPFFATLPQHPYDPEKAKYYLGKAGLTKLAIDLSAADGAFAGAVDMALLFQQSAAAAGIAVNVVKESDDGYWDNIWMKKPFYMSWFGGRPTADLMLSLAYKSDSPWNDTFWKSEEFDSLLVKARATADVAARKDMYAHMQNLVWETGGYLIPVFADNIDAHGPRVGGFRPNPNSDQMGSRCAEQVWLEA
ncbi:MAG TPA: ABC transporter substrate-binding protein [Nordella sp.]|nr:ABC transporter substrate-binding protein [Nordella sp.]